MDFRFSINTGQAVRGNGGYGFGTVVLVGKGGSDGFQPKIHTLL